MIKRRVDLNSCYQNMSKMMAVREKYSRNTRKEAHIKTAADRIDFFKETGLKNTNLSCWWKVSFFKIW